MLHGFTIVKEKSPPPLFLLPAEKSLVSYPIYFYYILSVYFGHFHSLVIVSVQL